MKKPQGRASRRGAKETPEPGAVECRNGQNPPAAKVRIMSGVTAKNLVGGLARLVEGQRCFAEELGLAYGRVFGDGYESFKNRKPEEVLREWLTGAEDGAEHLQVLLEDLLQHQLALMEALEGVADEVLRQLSPERIEQASPGVLGLRPLAWRRFRRLHAEFAGNPHLRHQKLILEGFLNGYVKAREQSRAAANPATGCVQGGSSS
ncbi:hypothetical protein DESUT3_00800 [Desulfuromonas versatilis]|uniref:Type VI secretion system FHA domain-containing protein n=1 Tax=Desulfuromonas versatilis TaxID=2802975 RepID=A0ABN6DUZ9_9BACT|nr:type VI secretion system-associated FHA domain protein [Desulfuromonas versatilis]BCR03011.1 hypothetical protein DESUT3_00800 [Desulfuromonas versatilis]